MLLYFWLQFVDSNTFSQHVCVGNHIHHSHHHHWTAPFCIPYWQHASEFLTGLVIFDVYIFLLGSVAQFNWTPVFKWCAVRCVS